MLTHTFPPPPFQSDPSPWQLALGAIERALPAWRQMCADWGIDVDKRHGNQPSSDSKKTKKKKKKKNKNKNNPAGGAGEGSAGQETGWENAAFDGASVSSSNGRGSMKDKKKKKRVKMDRQQKKKKKQGGGESRGGGVGFSISERGARGKRR